MKTLVLGGTHFVGRAIVEHSLKAGHEVTIFNRGKSAPGLFDGVEELVGDRDGDVSALAERSFDLVIDPSGYFARQVSSVLDALGDIGHYTFISSTSVYADSATPMQTEAAALASIQRPGEEDQTVDYGAHKAACEAVIDDRLAGRAHHVRSCVVVGPHDTTGRLGWWLERLAAGGPVMAPEPQLQPVQVIDVRDLAVWVLHAAEKGVSGAVNACSTPGELTLGEVLRTARDVVAPEVELQWVGTHWLLEHQVAPWQELPFWLPMRSHDGFMMRSNQQALDLGLKFRPFRDTVADTWLSMQSDERLGATRDFGVDVGEVGMSREREQGLLDHWLEHEAMGLGPTHSHTHAHTHSHSHDHGDHSHSHDDSDHSHSHSHSHD